MKHLTFHSRSWQTQVKNDLMNLTYCLPWVQSRAKYEIPVPWPASIVFLAYHVLCFLVQIEIVNSNLQENVHIWNYTAFSIHLHGLHKGSVRWNYACEAVWVFLFIVLFLYIYWFLFLLLFQWSSLSSLKKMISHLWSQTWRTGWEVWFKEFSVPRGLAPKQQKDGVLFNNPPDP